MGISVELVTPDADLVDEIERHVWAKELEVPFEKVEYGKILCGTDENGKPTGGLSDRGLLMSFFMMMDLRDGIGICTVEEKGEATFEAEEGEFGNFSDCKTISDMADILEAVRVRLITLATGA